MPLILGEVLKRKKITKRQFAKMLGIEYNNVFRLFRPSHNPTLRTLEKYASLLKIKVRSLFRG